MQSKINTPEAAFAYLGLPISKPEVSGIAPKHQKAIIALYLLFIITEARNKEANDGKDWVPVYDGSKWHYFPIFWMDDENGEACSGFRFFLYGAHCRSSSVGSRLEFKSSELCEDTANTFIDLYRDAFMLLPQPAIAEAPAQAGTDQ